MTKEKADLIITEQNKNTEEILKAVAKVKSDYHELCKLKDMRIAELEHQLTHRNCLDCSNHSSKLRMRTLELEKENAELKEKLNILDNCNRLGDMITEAYKDQLTKAKEHIRTLISCLIDWVQEGDKDYCHIAEAEQFLSEVEK